MNGTNNLVVRGEDKILTKLGFGRDFQYYDYVKRNPPNKVVVGSVLNATIFVEGFFQITDTNYIVELREDDIICVGKIENDIVVIISEEERQVINIMGLHHYDTQTTLEKLLISTIN